MKLNIIKSINGSMVSDNLLSLNEQSLESVMNFLSCFLSKKIQKVIDAGEVYEIINENNFIGFISDSFQMNYTCGHMVFVENKITVQYIFSQPQKLSLPILVA